MLLEKSRSQCLDRCGHVRRQLKLRLFAWKHGRDGNRSNCVDNSARNRGCCTTAQGLTISSKHALSPQNRMEDVVEGYRALNRLSVQTAAPSKDPIDLSLENIQVDPSITKAYELLFSVHERKLEIDAELLNGLPKLKHQSKRKPRISRKPKRATEAARSKPLKKHLQPTKPLKVQIEPPRPPKIQLEPAKSPTVQIEPPRPRKTQIEPSSKAYVTSNKPNGVRGPQLVILFMRL